MRGCSIHPALSYPTGDSWLPDPLFRISVKGVYRGSTPLFESLPTQLTFLSQSMDPTLARTTTKCVLLLASQHRPS